MVSPCRTVSRRGRFRATHEKKKNERERGPFRRRHPDARFDTELAAGHEGLGIATSLGTARLLADLVAGRTPAIDPAPYAPARALVEAV